MELIFDEAKVGEALLTFLQNINARTYFNRAPRTPTFPFAVFKIGSSFQYENAQSEFMLEIDIWDNKGNAITDLLTLQKSLLEGIHKKGYADSDTTFYFNVESILPIEDEEEQIRRRQLRVNVVYYNTQE